MLRALPTIALLALCSTAMAQDDSRAIAAERFERGRTLYTQGRYREAIRAFEAAHRAAPHAAQLFSVARCHESLGDAERALAFYQRALAGARDPALRSSIERRMEALRSRPVKVFVSSRPNGAGVTVDGRARPEPSKTPAVISLRPGEHVLLLRLEGHRLAARRVVVGVAKEQPVEVRLKPLPGPGRPCSPAPAPAFRAEKKTLVNLSALGAALITGGRPFMAGPGARALVGLRRFLLGGSVQYLAMATKSLTPQSGGGKEYDRNAAGALLALADAGYMIPFRTSYVYGTLGLGIFYEQHKFTGWDRSTTPVESIRRVEDDVAFAWSLGGGIEAAVTTWLSLGANVRFGVIHGERTDDSDPDKHEEGTAAPFTTFAAVVTFHI